MKKQVKVKDLVFGDGHVYIQTMATVKTSNLDKLIPQIKEIENAGCDLIRFSVLDKEDARAFKEIKKHTKMPLIADIHYDLNLAIEAIVNGADKIRINPGNTSKEKLFEVIKVAKEYGVAIRIGLNSGSFSSSNNIDEYIKEMANTIAIFEDNGFYDLILAFKSSDPNLTYELNKKASEIFPYPLHLGVTEAGYGKDAIIKSCVALVPLLKEGIGSTIRISLSEPPLEEVLACRLLLKSLGLRNNVPTLISCPTCGRTTVDVFKLSSKVSEYLNFINKDVRVAIMGCGVNGPGEAKEADFGIAGNNGTYIAFKNGKLTNNNLTEEEALNFIYTNIDNF